MNSVPFRSNVGSDGFEKVLIGTRGAMERYGTTNSHEDPMFYLGNYSILLHSFARQLINSVLIQRRFLGSCGAALAAPAFASWPTARRSVSWSPGAAF